MRTPKITECAARVRADRGRLRARHRAAAAVQHPAYRAIEPLLQRLAGLGRHRAEPQPGRLRAAQLLIGGAEILGRSAPAGTSVEPAFELTDEGLGARVDPSRPAIVRAYLPAGDSAAADACSRPS